MPPDYPNNPFVSPEGTRRHKMAVFILVVAPFFGLFAAIYSGWARYVTMLDIVLLIVGWQLTGYGVTIGFHRLLTHMAFKCVPAVKAILLALGTMSFEGSPAMWMAVHTIHHKYSDTEQDPHSPLKSFWHAHVGWLFSGSTTQEARYCRTFLSKDPMLMFFRRTLLFWWGLSLVAPLFIGGLRGYFAEPAIGWTWSGAWWGFVWGGLVRIGLTNHITWSVNSVCHTWGSRLFETDDRSMNNGIVALLSGGEGWHNNHHAFPRSPRHGLTRYQIDTSWLIISGLAKVGLVWGLEQTLPDWTKEPSMI